MQPGPHRNPTPGPGPELPARPAHWDRRLLRGAERWRPRGAGLTDLPREGQTPGAVRREFRGRTGFCGAGSWDGGCPWGQGLKEPQGAPLAFLCCRQGLSLSQVDHASGSPSQAPAAAHSRSEPVLSPLCPWPPRVPRGSLSPAASAISCPGRAPAPTPRPVQRSPQQSLTPSPLAQHPRLPVPAAALYPARTPVLPGVPNASRAHSCSPARCPGTGDGPGDGPGDGGARLLLLVGAGSSSPGWFLGPPSSS